MKCTKSVIFSHIRDYGTDLINILKSFLKSLQLAVHIFEAIMYSIQIDHSYIVIERIIAHIEKTTSILQKSNMAQVIHILASTLNDVTKVA